MLWHCAALLDISLFLLCLNWRPSLARRQSTVIRPSARKSAVLAWTSALLLSFFLRHGFESGLPAILLASRVLVAVSSRFHLWNTLRQPLISYLTWLTTMLISMVLILSDLVIVTVIHHLQQYLV
ncbi:hypothetical protein K438DRAFT_1778544 [Mycena galopus ATCC 62051]|nr:hypothetical protein K438DRAFT_1778544 [Mycena galopus ATCC 62051]